MKTRKRHSLHFWELYSKKEKRILITSLRYAISFGTLLALGYLLFQRWKLNHLLLKHSNFVWVSGAIEKPELIFLAVLWILLYNTTAFFLVDRVPLVPLAVGLSALDLFSTAVWGEMLLKVQILPTASIIFVSILLGNLLFLGIPTLSVLFGRKASFFSIINFFLIEGFFIIFLPDVRSQTPTSLMVIQMSFFTILAYLMGFVSEVEQNYQQKAETLGLLEKALRLDKEALVSDLEKANELKRQFLAFASHELRTPLHAVIGYTSCLLEGMEGALNSQQISDITRIESNVHYLIALIRDFLDLTHIESGKFKLDWQEISPEECIQEAIQSVLPLYQEKKLYIKSDISNTLPLVFADYERLKQIVINLLGNAVKFIEKGGVVISAEQKDQHLLISISDTGTGIKEQDIPHIFDEYQKFGEQKRGKEGSGLGLTIVKKLVDLHQGSISVDSKIGTGTTFLISLPIHQEL
jgi:signal transduction histidine kinase